MPLSIKPAAPLRKVGVHAWGLDKSGKTRFALSAPKPALINFDRNEDWLLTALGMTNILRDRIVLPAGEITPDQARAALKAFETDLTQAEALNKGGACESLIFDGGSTLEDIITIVTLDESKNPNNTYRYAGRNAYLKTLFNRLNVAGFNVIWISKAKPLWVADKRIAGEFVPDCHNDIPFMVDVNLQLKAELRPGGLNYYGVLGMNAFTDKGIGVPIPNMTWDLMMTLLFPAKPEVEQEAA